MSNIQGSGPVNPQDLTKYKAEYKQGVNLFQRALDEYSRADEVHKKDAFREVMDRALQVLNETAQGMTRKDLLQQNSQIHQDLLAFENAPTDQKKKQLENDLKNAQDSLG
jgi:hypothetical protein